MENTKANRAEELAAETECNGCAWLNICSQETKCLSCREQYSGEGARRDNRKCPLPDSLVNFYCKHSEFMTEHGYRGRFLASFGKNRNILDHWPETPEFCPIKNERKKQKGDAS